jgi:ORF6N domain
MSQPATLTPVHLAPLVQRIRHENVIIDSDLAELYGVEAKVLNQAVKRNISRFPEDFMFRLTPEEFTDLRRSEEAGLGLRSQIVTQKDPRGGRRSVPYAFTEQGVAMLSSVLRSPRAVEVNIAIMRTFAPPDGFQPRPRSPHRGHGAEI